MTLQIPAKPVRKVSTYLSAVQPLVLNFSSLRIQLAYQVGKSSWKSEDHTLLKLMQSLTYCTCTTAAALLSQGPITGTAEFQLTQGHSAKLW